MLPITPCYPCCCYFLYVGAGRTAAVLADASNCLQGSVELKLPDPKYAAAYELKPGSFNAAANDPEVARHMDECLSDWCRQVRVPHAASTDSQ